jgi:hypothetical protein
MIGESMPDQHKQAIAQLSAQIDHYLATGRRIQMIDAGISGEVPFTAISNRPKNLKAKRDKHEPRVHELAAQGSTASAIATATATAVGIDSRTVRLSPKSTTLAWPNRPDAQDKQPRTPAPPASLAGLASAPVRRTTQWKRQQPRNTRRPTASGSTPQRRSWESKH